jgi:hypothetical protein
LAWTNGAIVAWDGCTGHLQARLRIITFAVALLFGVIGGIVFGVERSLSRIWRCSDRTSGAQQMPELDGAWRLFYVLLTFGVLLVLVVMGSGLIAITSRLHQGFHIFG